MNRYTVVVSVGGAIRSMRAYPNIGSAILIADREALSLVAGRDDVRVFVWDVAWLSATDVYQPACLATGDAPFDGKRYAVVVANGGIVDEVSLFGSLDEAKEDGDAAADGLDPESDDVRVFEIDRDGVGAEVYSATIREVTP